MPAEHSMDDFCQESFVHVVEIGRLQLRIEEFVQVRIGTVDAVQDLDRSPPRSAIEVSALGLLCGLGMCWLVVHNPLIPREHCAEGDSTWYRRGTPSGHL